MTGRSHIKLLGAVLLLSGLCTGCAGQPADALYALPKQPDDYYQLQSAIDEALTEEASYSGPLTGSNQQAVQLADLDGDGRDEAIVFVKTAAEKGLKAYIFDESEAGGYENTAVIEGDGSAFDAVEYAQLDEEAGMEILVGRQLSEQISQSLGAYSYRDGQLVELLSTNYTEFTAVDLDGDERRDVFVLRQAADGRAGVAELYRWRDGQMEREPEASLSAGAKQIKRMVTGYVSADVPAVFVASAYGEGDIVTDIFTCGGSGFSNIAANAETGLSVQTVRNYHVYAADIDQDDLVELPSPVVLPSGGGTEEIYWVIDWYNLLPDGSRENKMTTFHHYQGGWYLELPEQWYGGLTVSRRETDAGVRGYVFSRWNGPYQTPEEIFTVYAFTGNQRLELAETDGRFLLAEKGETAFSAEFGKCPWAEEMTEEDLRQMFRFIQVDWNSGEI